MKSFVMALVLLTSAHTFAGPEEHIEAQVCYHLNEAKAAQAPASVPKTVCIETLSIGENGSSVKAYSYFMSSLYQNIQLDYYARHNENGFTFRTSSPLSKIVEPNCGADEAVTLHIDGRADNDNIVDILDLEIYVETLATANSCQSAVQKTVFTYSK